MSPWAGANPLAAALIDVLTAKGPHHRVAVGSFIHPAHRPVLYRGLVAAAPLIRAMLFSKCEHVHVADVVGLTLPYATSLEELRCGRVGGCSRSRGASRVASLRCCSL